MDQTAILSQKILEESFHFLFDRVHLKAGNLEK